MFTDPNTHIDFGFGFHASNFNDTADFLWDNNPNKNTAGLLPNLYLYRHSIELYLKSLIVIIHKKLKLDYKEGDIPFDSREPYIMYEDSKGEIKWNKMTRSHFISTLYGYFEKLVIENEDELRKKSSQPLSVIINPDNRKIVDHIKKYDDSSTYFRYSDFGESNQKRKESEKHYNKKIEIQNLRDHIDVEKPSSIFVIVDPVSGEPIEAHKGAKEMPLSELAGDIKKLVEYFSGIHVMFRICLCNGY